MFGSSCATPAAVSARRSSRSREDMCIMLAARKVPAALKWIEDRRENLMSAGQARHVDGQRQDGLRRGRQHPRGRHRLSPGHRCVPDASSAESGGHRHVLPRPVPGSEGQLQLTRRCSPTPAVWWRIAVLGSSRPSGARSCLTSPRARSAWIPSIFVAGTCCAATRCRTSIRTACRTTTLRRSRPSSRP